MNKLIYGSILAAALMTAGSAFAQTTGTTYGTTGTSNTTSSSGSSMTSGTSNGASGANGTSGTNGSTNSSVTPVFYSQNGTAVNPNGAALTPGYYYNSSGQQVYYYGNGTYYNPSTGQYGGQAFGTNGYMTTGGANGSSSYPGVPNTGVGGAAEATWLALVAAAAAAGAGLFYLRNRAVTR